MARIEGDVKRNLGIGAVFFGGTINCVLEWGRHKMLKSGKMIYNSKGSEMIYDGPSAPRFPRVARANPRGARQTLEALGKPRAYTTRRSLISFDVVRKGVKECLLSY